MNQATTTLTRAGRLSGFALLPEALALMLAQQMTLT